ncbi:MAG: sigma-70 family RNA polymerase sigma factor [Planctomycetota bacterium]|nr:sigma-70 family RNA polymerase sigma factor [Planctomycetota bacterium]
MFDADTQGDLFRKRFSASAWSRVVRESDGLDQETLSKFLSSYWRPTYLYIRRDRRKSNEIAKDLTQDFFAHLIEKDILDKYRPELGRLRTFLKVALKNFLADKERRVNAVRRGGGRKLVSFDQEEVQRLDEMARGEDSPDHLFDQEWAYDLLRDSVEEVRDRLKKSEKEIYWTAYESYDLESSSEQRPTYREIAEQLEVREEQVTRYISFVRKNIRQEMIQRLGNQVTSEQDLHREMEELLGE